MERRAGEDWEAREAKKAGQPGMSKVRVIPALLRVQRDQRTSRCMRHYAIYAVRWPERTPLDGTPAFLPTPRDPRSSTPAYLSQKNLATLNHKLSNAAFNSVSASASASRSASAVRAPTLKRQRTEEAEPPPSKRQKVAPPPSGRPRGRPNTFEIRPKVAFHCIRTAARLVPRTTLRALHRPLQNSVDIIYTPRRPL